MIINSLKINNIYSLKGSHTIDFQKIQKHSTLLAITGKTGAGKSTILNCISLALFGKTHIKALTKEDYLTLGESRGSIELNFSITGKNYIVTWSLTAKGSLSRKIIIDNNVITQKINEHILKIIKLNFDQFNKTIILNQGEFANFISSSFAQRKDILEELTGTQNLKELSKKIKVQIKDLVAQKLQLTDKIEASTIMGPDEEAELQKQQTNINIDLDKFHDQRLSLEHIHLVYNTVYKNTERFLTNNKSLKSCQNEIKEIISKQNSYKSKLEQLKNKFTIIDQEFNQLKPNIEKALEFEINTKSQQEKHSFIISEEKKVSLKNSDALQQDILLTKKIDSLQAQKMSLSNSLGILTENISLLNIQHAITSLDELPLIQQNINNIKSQLETNHLQITQDKTVVSNQEIDILEIQKKLIISDVDQYSQEVAKYQKKVELTDCKILELTVSFEKLKERNTTYKNISQSIKKLEMDIKSNQLLYDAKEKEKQHATLIYENILKNIEVQQLQKAIHLISIENSNHSHCVVCHNPLSSKDIIKNVGDIQELLLQQESAKLELNDIVADLAKHQSNDLSSKREQAKLNTEALFIQDEIAVLTKQTVQSDLMALRDNKAKSTEYISQLHASHKEIAFLTKNIDQLKVKIKVMLETQLTSQQLLDDNMKTQKIQWEKISSYFGQQMSETHIKDIKSLKMFCLRVVDIYNMEKEIKDFKKYQQTLIKQQKDLETERTAIEQIIKLNQIEVNVLIGIDNSPKILKQQWEQRLSSATAEIRQLQTLLDSEEFQRRDMQGRIELLNSQTKLILQDSADLLSTIHSINYDVGDKVTDKAIRFKDKLETMIKTPQQDTLVEFKYLIDDLVQNPLEKLKQSIELLKDKKSKLDERMYIHHQQQERQQHMVHQFESIDKELLPKQELFQILGNDEFRNYLLTIIEQQLITQSNLELQSLCSGRYKIIQQSSEFYIIDGNKNGQTRKISTLSGGEKFMVSLAMALALAEMTRGAAKIDSFFIDEGFGSLDSDYLDEVLEVLNDVQARGKSITIITHIEDLYRRIPVNLHIKKEHNGESKIHIVHN